MASPTSVIRSGWGDVLSLAGAFPYVQPFQTRVLGLKDADVRQEGAYLTLQRIK